jgi:putative membrane protein
MILTESNKQTIAETIKRAELTTSGEIVFAITNTSARYHDASLQAALAGSIAAAAVYLALPLLHTIPLLLWTEIIAFALFYGVSMHSSMRRWFIRTREMDERVHDAAFREFYGSGLYKTREANGVLIYLSCFERKVVVVGDAGIHKKMGNQHWLEVRDQIINGIRKGKAREGICTAVETCGKALAAHFPRRSDDQNELSNQVIDRTK